MTPMTPMTKHWQHCPPTTAALSGHIEFDASKVAFTPPTMNRDCNTQLTNLIKEKTKDWCPVSICVPAKLTGVNGEINELEINLVDYIGKASKYAQQLRIKPLVMLEGHKQPIVFPLIKDCTEAPIKSITSHLVKVCAQDGFSLVNNGYEKKKKKLVFKCQRGYLYKSKKSAGTETSKQ